MKKLGKQNAFCVLTKGVAIINKIKYLFQFIAFFQLRQTAAG